jgi:hypothetical protein
VRERAAGVLAVIGSHWGERSEGLVHLRRGASHRPQPDEALIRCHASARSVELVGLSLDLDKEET